jgi:hypothetical protein
VDLLLVLLVVVAPVYIGAMMLLAIGLCRAAKRGDELELAADSAPPRRARARRERSKAPLALVSGRR